MSAIIVRKIQVFANNVVFTLIKKLCLYEIVINYLLSPFLCYFSVSIRSFYFHSFCFRICNNVYPKYFQRYKKDVSQ